MRPSIRRIHVLKEYAPYLRLLRTYYLKNEGENDSGTYRNDIINAVIVTFVVFLHLVQMFCGYWYCEEHHFALSEITATVPVLLHSIQYFLAFVSMSSNYHKIDDTLQRLQRIVNNRCDVATGALKAYEQQEQKHAFLVGALNKFSKIVFFFMHVPPSLLPIMFLLFKFPPPDHWISIFINHELFDQKTFHGFYMNWFISLASSAFFFISMLASAILFTGLCFYVTGMVADMTTQMKHINRSIQSNESTHNFEKLDIWSKYVQEIRLHHEIIELAEAVRFIMLDLLFYQLLVCAVVIAFNLFGLETAELDLHTFLASAELIDTVILTYIYCYLSEQITSDLVDIGDIFYGSDWYGMPVKFQKLVTLPILRSQREIQLSGLGLIDCTLSVYLSLIKTAGSYFLLMRSL